MGRLLDVKKKTESVVAARQWGREEAEANLTLAGFLIVDCPLKRDSKQVITALQVPHTSHQKPKILHT